MSISVGNPSSSGILPFQSTFAALQSKFPADELRAIEEEAVMEKWSESQMREVLQNKIDTLHPDYIKDTDFVLIAAKYSQWDIVKKILNLEGSFPSMPFFDVHATLSSGPEEDQRKTGLWYAVKARQWEIVSLMFLQLNGQWFDSEEVQRNVNYRIDALDYLATVQKWGFNENPIVDLLRDKNEKSQLNKNLVLLVAAKWGAWDVVDELLEEPFVESYSLDLDIGYVISGIFREERKRTALWYAVASEKWEVVSKMSELKISEFCNGGGGIFEAYEFLNNIFGYKIKVVNRWALIQEWDEAPLEWVRLTLPLTTRCSHNILDPFPKDTYDLLEMYMPTDRRLGDSLLGFGGCL